MGLLANSVHNNACRSTGSSGKINKPCFKFARGFCRFGDNFRYMHSRTNNGANGNTSLWSTNTTRPTTSSVSLNMTPEQMMVLIYMQQALLNQYGYPGNAHATVNHSPQLTVNCVTDLGSIQPLVGLPSPPVDQSSSVVQPGQSGTIGQSGQLLGQLSGQETTLPNAFNAMTLQDPSSDN
ncbi:ribonuclease H-like domain-containing protein [Tanacetum coccineum]